MYPQSPQTTGLSPPMSRQSPMSTTLLTCLYRQGHCRATQLEKFRFENFALWSFQSSTRNLNHIKKGFPLGDFFWMFIKIKLLCPINSKNDITNASSDTKFSRKTSRVSNETLRSPYDSVTPLFQQTDCLENIFSSSFTLLFFHTLLDSRKQF